VVVADLAMVDRREKATLKVVSPTVKVMVFSKTERLSVV